MPLVIYADVLVVVNLYVDFFLLWCVKKALGLRARARRLVLGALAGALAALLALPPGQPGWLSFLLGAATALGAAGAAFAPLAPRMFAKAALCLWLFSFLLAGFCLFAIRFFAPRSLAVVGSAVYFDLSLPLLFCLTCGAYGAFWVFRRVLPRDAGAARSCAIAVEHQGRRAELFAKADTGSGLREPFSGLPVVVCQADRLAEVAPDGLLAWGQGEAAPEEVPGLRLVPFTSLGGAGVLPAFRPERVTAGKTGKPLDCYVALYPGQLSAGEYDALFNPDLFPEEAGVG